MRYAVRDLDSGKECTRISNLIMLYDNPREKAYEVVNSLNNERIKDGYPIAYEVIEIDDSNIILFNEGTSLLEAVEALELIEDACNSEAELIEVVTLLNAHSGETGKHYNIVTDNDKVSYLANWR